MLDLWYELFTPILSGQIILKDELEEFTPQPYKPINGKSPIGLDLELLSGPPKTPPKVPVA